MLERGHVRHIVKMHYFFLNLLYSQAYIRQTKYIIMMTKVNISFHIGWDASLLHVFYYHM